MASVTGTSVRFNGTSTVITVSDTAKLDCDVDFSVNLRIRQDAANTGKAPLIYRASWMDISIQNSRVVALIGTALTHTYKVSIPKDVLVDIAMTFVEDGTSLVTRLYIDGVMVEKYVHETGALPAASTEDLVLGSDGTYFFLGDMCGFIMTEDVLTDAEILALYDAGFGVTITAHDNPITELPFNEGTGTSLDDDSAQTNDGTITDETWLLNFGPHRGMIPTLQFKNQDDRLVGKFIVNRVRWVAPTTNGHKAQITDWAGKEVLNMAVNTVGLVDQYVEVGRVWNGIKVPDLDSGYLEIEIA